MHAQVSAKELEDTEQRLRSINSLAQVVRAQRADVKADYVLGIGGFDLDRLADEVDPCPSCLALPDCTALVPTHSILLACGLDVPFLLAVCSSRMPPARTECSASVQHHSIPDAVQMVGEAETSHSHSGHHEHSGHDHNGHAHGHEEVHAHAHDHAEDSNSHDAAHAHDHSHDHVHAHAHAHGHEHHHHHHVHDDSVGSVSLQLDGDLDLDKVSPLSACPESPLATAQLAQMWVRAWLWHALAFLG